MAKTTYALSILVVFFSLAIVAHSSCMYTVKLKTGDKENAGTDAEVLLRLFDNKGNSIDAPNLKLYGDGGPDSKDYFEMGELDKFKIPGECLQICKMELSHDNSGYKSGWNVNYLEVIVVNDETGINFAAKTFNINQWLARDEPPYSLSVIKSSC